jgi:hypothetical protein
LERLVEALYQAQEGEPKYRHRWLATYDRLINDAALRLAPGQTREQLHDAILFYVRQKKAALKRPPTLPPKA